MSFNQYFCITIFVLTSRIELEIRKSTKKEKSSTSRYVPIFSMSNIQILWTDLIYYLVNKLYFMSNIWILYKMNFLY